jgi:hypothetical protein
MGKLILVQEMNWVYEITQGCKGKFVGLFFFWYLQALSMKNMQREFIGPTLFHCFDKNLYIMDNISLQNQSSQA